MSRNNYRLFPDIYFKYSGLLPKGLKAFNIDILSATDQRLNGYEIMEQFGIEDIEVENPRSVIPTYVAIQKAIEYVSEKYPKIEWLDIIEHDCPTVEPDFWDRFDAILKKNPNWKKDVGVIGFNVLDSEHVGESALGRGVLIDGIEDPRYDYVYRNMSSEWFKPEYFVVEATYFSHYLINVDLWKKHIVPDPNFVCYLHGDAISTDFWIKNIPSITIPSLTIRDYCREKNAMGIPNAVKCNSYYHLDKYNHQKIWFEKYGYNYGNRQEKRADFARVLEKYKGTGLEKVYYMKLSDGPQF